MLKNMTKKGDQARQRALKFRRGFSLFSEACLIVVVARFVVIAQLVVVVVVLSLLCGK